MADGDGDFYLEFFYRLLLKNLTLSTDVLNAILVHGYTPVAATHSTYSDVSGYEVSGTNYTAGGIALVNKSVTKGGSSVIFNADDITWPSLGADVDTPGYVIVRDVTYDCLVCYWEHSTCIPDGSNYIVELNPTGIFYMD